MRHNLFKYLGALTIILASTGIVCGQACGKYRIRYVGQVQSTEYEVLQIKLPQTRLLHGYVDTNSSSGYIVLDNQNSDSLNFEIHSHLTSELYGDPNSYLEIYKKACNKLPVKFLVKNRNKEKEIVIHIPWDKIVITLSIMRDSVNSFRLI